MRYIPLFLLGAILFKSCSSERPFTNSVALPICVSQADKAIFTNNCSLFISLILLLSARVVYIILVFLLRASLDVCYFTSLNSERVCLSNSFYLFMSIQN